MHSLAQDAATAASCLASAGLRASSMHCVYSVCKAYRTLTTTLHHKQSAKPHHVQLAMLRSSSSSFPLCPCSCLPLLCLQDTNRPDLCQIGRCKAALCTAGNIVQHINFQPSVLHATSAPRLCSVYTQKCAVVVYQSESLTSVT